MTIGELRRIIGDAPDEMPVVTLRRDGGYEAVAFTVERATPVDEYLFDRDPASGEVDVFVVF